MPDKKFISEIWTVLKNSFKGFVNDKVPKLSASLSYYMIFSMGPLLLVIITMCSIFLGREAIEGGIYRQLENFTGADTALQLQQIIKNASLSGKTIVATIIGAITLLIGATTVFGEMQDSINMIWGVKAKPKKNWLKFFQDRIISFSVIISLSFLLLVSLGISALIEGFGNFLQQRFPDVTVVVFYIINLAITMAITSFIFGIVFKVLPDAEIRWKDVLAGAVVTTILFLLGKFGISFYISKTAVGSTYGPAGSLIILIVWIYYSAMILYFGAEFTKYYALQYGAPIHPSKFAVTVQQIETEKGNLSIQQNEQVKDEKMQKK
ncbi:MAG: YihY/virulence factor BrkB family protein [Chitinophagaceae bacterium]